MKKRMTGLFTTAAILLSSIPMTANAADLNDYLMLSENGMYKSLADFSETVKYDAYDSALLMTDENNHVLEIYNSDYSSLLCYPNDKNDAEVVRKIVKQYFPESYCESDDYSLNKFGYIMISSLDADDEQIKQFCDEITTEINIDKIVYRHTDYSGTMWSFISYDSQLFSSPHDVYEPVCGINMYTESDLYNSDTLSGEQLVIETPQDTRGIAKAFRIKTTTTAVDGLINELYGNGDANCDGEISLSDAVAILQYLSNSVKYPLSEQGLINADIDGGGVSGTDALEIQKTDALK